MKNKIIIQTSLLFFLLLLFIPFSFSQTGSLKGKVIDKKTNEPLYFASVLIENNGKNYGGTSSEEDGQYIIKPIPIGKYTIRAAFYPDYKIFIYNDIVIRADEVKIFDIKMERIEDTFDFDSGGYIPVLIENDKYPKKTDSLKRMKSKPFKPLE